MTPGWERKVTCNDLTHGLAQDCCKFGIGRIPQVLNARIRGRQGLVPITGTRWPDRHHHASALFNHETAQVIVPFSSYLWNHDAAQFHPVRFDDQVHISQHPPPRYSPDGELFPCLPKEDSHVRVWDTRTGYLVSKFPTSEVDGIALSPVLTHSLGETLVALSFQRERVIRLFDAYTDHLHAHILGKTYANSVGKLLRLLLQLWCKNLGA